MSVKTAFEDLLRYSEAHDNCDVTISQRIIRHVLALSAPAASGDRKQINRIAETFIRAGHGVDEALHLAQEAVSEQSAAPVSQAQRSYLGSTPDGGIDDSDRSAATLASAAERFTIHVGDLTEDGDMEVVPAAAYDLLKSTNARLSELAAERLSRLVTYGKQLQIVRDAAERAGIVTHREAMAAARIATSECRRSSTGMTASSGRSRTRVIAKVNKMPSELLTDAVLTRYAHVLQLTSQNQMEMAREQSHDLCMEIGLTMTQLGQRVAAQAKLANRAATSVDWQPMETAPQTETALFWIVPKSPEESYTNTSGTPIVSRLPPRLFYGKRGEWSAVDKATHWMLPAPPAFAAEKEKGRG